MEEEHNLRIKLNINAFLLSLTPEYSFYAVIAVSNGKEY